MSFDALSKGILRRVHKELNNNYHNAQLLDDKYIYIPITLYPPLQKRAKKAGVDPALIFTLKNYPWRAPDVHYCSIPLYKIYKCGGPVEYMDELIKIAGKYICLGCTSILCGDTWIATNNIKDVVDEFKHFTKLKARIVERIICNKIQESLFQEVAGTLLVTDYKIADFL